MAGFRGVFWVWICLSFFLALCARSSVSSPDAAEAFSSSSSSSLPAALHSRTKHAALGDAPVMAKMMAPERMDAMQDASGMSAGGFAPSPPQMDAAAFSSPISSFVEGMQKGPPASTEPLPGELTGSVILREGGLEGSVGLGQISPALAALEAATEAAGGRVESSYTSTDSWLLQRWKGALEDPGSAAARRVEKWGPSAREALEAGAPTSFSATLRIPSDTFEATKAALKAALLGSPGVTGTIRSERSSAQDVTEGYRDTVGRLRVDKAALDALKALLSAAANVHEVLAIKREMDQIQGRIEGGEATRKSIEGRARLGLLAVNFNVEEPPANPPAPPPPPPSWSPLGAFSRALGALANLGVWAVEVAIFAVVFSLPTGVLLGLLSLLINRLLPGGVQGLFQRLQGWAPLAGAGGSTRKEENA
jgi:hypothetical protein